jgi:hypothetical protein
MSRSPYELWVEAGGDRERYRALLRERGVIRDLEPGEQQTTLPCGWPKRRESEHAEGEEPTN